MNRKKYSDVIGKRRKTLAPGDYLYEKKERNYEIMEKWVEKDKESIVIICGVFNAAMAEEGGLRDLEEEKKTR